jgi:hypothetical protein
MKHIITILNVCMLIVFCISCNSKNPATENKTENTVAEKPASSNAIDGAWQTVSFIQNNQPAVNNQVKIFSNGVFSMVSWDSSGKLAYAGYGKYELDGNTYKETFLYHDNPKYSGGQDWQEYEMKGDTLIMKGFIKVIVGGKDVTVDFPKFEEKRIRVK